ncbi:MAG: hypothetical protein QXO80_06005, partial [Thermosphaera sp.]
MKVIKISDEAYERLKNLSETRQLSISDVVDDILRVYFGGTPDDKAINKIIDKDIVIQFETKCRKCGRTLAPGDIAHYTRYVYDDKTSKTFITCMDCYTHSALAKMFIEKKRLETIIKQLKDEANKIADRIIEAETQYNIAVLRGELFKVIHELSLNSVRRMLGEQADQLAVKVEEVLRKLEQIDLRL